MPRPTLINGDTFFDALANAAGLPILDGQDEYGHGAKLIDDHLSDLNTQIKALFYAFYNRVRISLPVSGRTVTYGSYTVVVAGTRLTFAAGSLTLPDNSSGFVVVGANGVIVAAATLPFEGIHIGNYVTSGGNVAAFVDTRYQTNETIRPLVIPPQDILQIGDVKFSARLNPSAGFLRCDHTSYLISAFPLLAAAIGNQFNLPGDGIGTFRVPPAAGRAIAGVSPTKPLGLVEGVATAALSVSQLPSHSHGVTQTPHNHAIANAPHTHSVVDGGHNHPTFDPGHNHPVADNGHDHGLGNYRRAVMPNNNPGQLGAELSTVGGGAPVRFDREDAGIKVQTAVTGIVNGVSIAGVSISSANGAGTVLNELIGLTVQPIGGSQAFSVVQPTTYLNCFIRAF